MEVTVLVTGAGQVVGCSYAGGALGAGAAKNMGRTARRTSVEWNMLLVNLCVNVCSGGVLVCGGVVEMEDEMWEEKLGEMDRFL